MLEVWILGQFQVKLNGEVVQIPWRPAQSMLAYLVLTAGTAHRREKLAGLFWPDSAEANARRNLRQALWRLRQALGADGDYFLADGLTITFDDSTDFWLDTAVLDQRFSGDPSLDELLNVVTVYKGELLPGFYDEWIVLERERLQAVFEQRMSLLLQRLVQAGRWSDALGWSESWIALGGVPEPAYRALMVAHAGLGDLSSVAATYQRCVETLRREIDVEPSKQTQELYQKLATGEMPILEPTVSPEQRRISDEEEEPEPGGPPFKGLQYFDESDADLFFGRENLTAKLVARLDPDSFPEDQWGGGRFVAVVGASGSGKSSIVQAGLIPALKRGKPLVDGSLPPAGSMHWPVHIITPTARPLEALAVSLTRDEESVTATATLLDDLARDPRSMHLYVRRRLGSEKRPLLVVVDQFEELFTLCRNEVERQRFVDNLLTAACPSASGAKDGGCQGTRLTIIVLALRADFYAHCGYYAELREALERHQVFIGPMSATELRRAIEEPARRGNWSIEPGLVEIFLQEVGDEPGGLPLLSHTLLETWRRRRGRMLTLSGFHESGGVRGAIAQTADRVLDEMDAEQQAIARSIFLRLTELGEGTQDTRRRAEHAELVSDATDSLRVDAVVQRLVEARLVTASEGVVEVAHEVLIREWPTLRRWLDEDRAALRLHRHLTEAAQAWVRLDRDPGELYRGARLVQASEYAEEGHSGELNPLELEFLEASQERALQREEEREAQRQRELDAARRLAEEKTRTAAAERRRAEEQARASRRLRWLVAGLGLLLLVVFVSAFLAIQQARRAEQQTRIAMSRELAAAALTQLDADPERSILLALEAVDVTNAADGIVLPEAANALHRAIPASRVELSLTGHDGQVWGIAYSRDGERLATGSDDGVVRVWDARTGQELLTLTGHTEPLNGVAFSPDGTRLASASLDGTARVWDTATGQELLTLIGHTDGLLDVAFSPDGRHLATAGKDQTARVWDAVVGEELLTLTGHERFVMGVTFSPDGRNLATASYDGTARVWELDTGRQLFSLTGHESLVTDVAFSPDGRRLATGSMDSTVIVWNVSNALSQPTPAETALSEGEVSEVEGPAEDLMTPELLHTLVGHTNELTRLDFSPDSKYLATTSADRQVIVWDLESGEEDLRLVGHGGWTTNVAFSPDGQHLATASSDATARIWDWASPSRELLTLAGHTEKINGIVLSPDGSRLATTGLDQVTKIWDPVTGEELLTISEAGATPPRFWVHNIAFSPDGTRLTTVAADDSPRVWDAVTGQELASLAGHEAPVGHVDFGPDGTRLVTASEDHTARVWDAATGQQVAVLLGHAAPVFHAAFSPDGALVATASEDNTARLWDAATGREMLTLTGHTDWIYKVVFSSDGTRLVTVPTGFDWAAKVWNVATGEEILTLEGHNDSVWEAAFSPDGTLLATASRDGTARIWDATTGEALQILTGHTSTIFDLAFSPDGARLATAGYDAEVRVWDVTSGQELLVLSGHTSGVNTVAFSLDGTQLITASDDGMVRIYVLPIEELVTLGQARLTRAWTKEECLQFLHLPEEQCPPAP
jgi:WD40 repeat protein/DNA-binding SARP family transcriptional activator